MKRLFAGLLAMTMVLGLSGCTDTTAQDAKNVVSEFYDDLQKGDYESAQKLYVEDADADQDLSSLIEAMDELETAISAEELGLSDSQKTKVKDAADDFAKQTIASYVQEYEITDAQVNDDKDKVEVTVKTTGIDMEKAEEVDTTAIENELTSKYEEEFTNAILNGDTSAAYDSLTNMFVELFSNYSEKISGVETSDRTETVVVVKEGDGDDATWKIKSITTETDDSSSDTSEA